MLILAQHRGSGWQDAGAKTARKESGEEGSMAILAARPGEVPLSEGDDSQGSSISTSLLYCTY